VEAGIDGTGVTALGTRWFLAEGATARSSTRSCRSPPRRRAGADPRGFQRPFGAPPVQRDYEIPALQRLTIPVEQVDPALAATSVSITITSTTGAGRRRAVDVVARQRLVRRTRNARHHTMGTAWAVRDGITGIADHAQTYMLVASGASATNDSHARDPGPRRRPAVGARLRRRVDAEQPPDHRLSSALSPRVLDEHVGVILESMGQTAAGRGHADADRRRARDVQRTPAA
jgi:hypothetical protein